MNQSGRAVTQLELLDRMLDKGVVFDVELHVEVGGIELMTVESQIVVMSLERRRELEADPRWSGSPDGGVISTEVEDGGDGAFEDPWPRGDG